VQGGAELAEGVRVTSIGVERASVRVRTTAGTVAARAVVVTAGAWAADLLRPLEIDLPVIPTRETVAYVDLPRALELPPLIDYARIRDGVGTQRSGRAGYALGAPGVGLKIGLHHAGPVTDPDAEGVPDETVVAWAAAWARERYPDSGAMLGAETCVYTNTADEGFVLERHGRVVVGSACSGHGFKFAPLVGRTLAALAAEAAH
jgi:sarcosine oxidase